MTSTEIVLLGLLLLLVCIFAIALNVFTKELFRLLNQYADLSVQLMNRISDIHSQIQLNYRENHNHRTPTIEDTLEKEEEEQYNYPEVTGGQL